MRRSKQRNHKSTSRKSIHSYQPLEDRLALATVTSIDLGTGTLNISLDDNLDQAIINTVGGLVSVNASTDLDAGQTMDIGDLRVINVSGDPTMTGQAVTLAGDFTNGTGGADLQTLSISEVGNVAVLGLYEFASDVTVTLSNSGGLFEDSNAGQLVVNGTLDVNARDNAVLLDNVNNDFNTVSVSTIGFGNNATFTDVDDIEFADVSLTGNLVVVAGGAVSDAAGAVIAVNGDGEFAATEVTLGEDTNGTTDFGRVILNTTGNVELTEDSNIIFGGVSAVGGDLTATTDDAIFDGRKTMLNVAGSTVFTGLQQIRVGDHGADIFNTFDLNFNSNGHVDIFENSDMDIVGTNTALTMDITSWGDIEDGPQASIIVDNGSSIFGENVLIGENSDPLNVFMTGNLLFNAVGTFELHEDDGIDITEAKNFANRLILESAGEINDTEFARIEVTELAMFDATAISLGEQTTDEFTAGWITFNTVGETRISENDSMTIANINSAGSAVFTSPTVIDTEAESQTTITGTAAFTGTNINLGTATTDVFTVGGIVLNGPNATQAAEANVFTNGDLQFQGSSSVDNLDARAEGGNVFDDVNASLDTRVSSFVSIGAGTTVSIGDTGNQFTTRFLTFRSPVSVTIAANSATTDFISFAGTSSTGALNITTPGSILDDMSTVDVDSAVLDGFDVILGENGECFDVASDMLTVMAANIENVNNDDTCGTP